MVIIKYLESYYYDDQILIHLSYLQLNGNMNYSWNLDLWLKYHSKQPFQDSPIGNSDSRTGLTRNPVHFARLWRKLQTTMPTTMIRRTISSRMRSANPLAASCLWTRPSTESIYSAKLWNSFHLPLIEILLWVLKIGMHSNAPILNIKRKFYSIYSNLESLK